jgi:hypothetical protein
MGRHTDWNYAMFVLENVALYFVIGALCWHFRNGWPLLALLVLNREYTGNEQTFKDSNDGLL